MTFLSVESMGPWIRQYRCLPRRGKGEVFTLGGGGGGRESRGNARSNLHTGAESGGRRVVTEKKGKASSIIKKMGGARSTWGKNGYRGENVFSPVHHQPPQLSKGLHTSTAPTRTMSTVLETLARKFNR